MNKICLIIVCLALILTGCNQSSISKTVVTEIPKNETTENETTENETTDDSSESTTMIPDVPSMETTEEVSTEPQTETKTEEVSTEASTQVPTQAPTQPPTQVPTQPSTQAPTQPPTQPLTEPPTQAPIQPPTEPPTQAPTQPPTEPPTQAPTEPPTEPPTVREVVDFISEESSVTSDFKYGVKKIEVTVTNYYVYSDGSKEYCYDFTDYKYDYSGYSATDAELLEESIALANANMAYYNEILTLVNQIRAEAGVQPLTLDTTLCQAATMRSIEMNYSYTFSHTRPGGRGCFSVFDIFSIGVCASGENIARGYPTPAAVVEGWKNSQGHYENMIYANFNKMGVGMCNLSEYGIGPYWTQLFTE